MNAWRWRILVVAAALLPCSLAAAESPAAPTFTVQRDIVYAEKDGATLLADVYRPAGDEPRPAVLVVHGGAWIVGNKTQLGFAARRLAQQGFVAMAINYRLAPRFKFPAQLEDCRAAVEFLREHADEYHVDPKRIAGLGYSAGGHLVALLGAGGHLNTDNAPDDATQPLLRAVVAGGAPCDFSSLPPTLRILEYWLGGTRQQCPEVYEHASPLRFVTADDPPMLFFHGAQDLLVDKSSPTAMVAALAAAGVQCKLTILPDKGHAGAMFDPRFVEASVEFLNEHLKAPAE